MRLSSLSIRALCERSLSTHCGATMMGVSAAVASGDGQPSKKTQRYDRQLRSAQLPPPHSAAAPRSLLAIDTRANVLLLCCCCITARLLVLLCDVSFFLLGGVLATCLLNDVGFGT